MLRTTRVSVRNTPANWPELQARFDGWLVTRARQLGEQTYYKPAEILPAFRSRLEDMRSALPRIPLEDVPDFALALVRQIQISGPTDVCRPNERPSSESQQTHASLHGGGPPSAGRGTRGRRFCGTLPARS